MNHGILDQKGAKVLYIYIYIYNIAILCDYSTWSFVVASRPPGCEPRWEVVSPVLLGWG